MTDYTRAELLKLLAETHQALEAVTDRHGCDLRTAKVLCDGETALRNPGIKAEMATAERTTRKGARLHVIH